MNREVPESVGRHTYSNWMGRNGPDPPLLPYKHVRVMESQSSGSEVPRTELSLGSETGSSNRGRRHPPLSSGESKPRYLFRFLSPCHRGVRFTNQLWKTQRDVVLNPTKKPNILVTTFKQGTRTSKEFKCRVETLSVSLK